MTKNSPSTLDGLNHVPLYSTGFHGEHPGCLHDHLSVLDGQQSLLSFLDLLDPSNPSLLDHPIVDDKDPVV